MDHFDYVVLDMEEYERHHPDEGPSSDPDEDQIAEAELQRLYHNNHSDPL